MDFSSAPEQAAFRPELGEWLAAKALTHPIPPPVATTGTSGGTCIPEERTGESPASLLKEMFSARNILHV
jgi:hypothetical protein